MNRLVVKQAQAYKVEVFIGCDDVNKAVDAATTFCTAVGLCVTVTPTTYAYRNGSCAGIVVGLINYARFPKDDLEIWNTATSLGFFLKRELQQGSFTVQDHNVSTFYSDRDEDQ